MKITKEDILKAKPYLIVSGFTIILAFIIFNYQVFFNIFGSIFKILTPLWYGILLAFILNIPMKNIEKLIKKITKKESFITKRSRGISIALTIIFAIIILVIFGSIIVPQVSKSFMLLFNNAATYSITIVNNINNLLDTLNITSFRIDTTNIQNMFANGFNWDQFAKTASSWINGYGTSLLNNALGFTAELANWFTGFMISLYLLSSKEKFIRQLRKLIASIFPFETTETIFLYGKDVNRTFTSFFSGQLLEACILGILCYIGMLIFNFPFAPLISVVVTMTAIIPMFGAMFAMLFGCLIILAVRPPMDVIWFIIYFQCLQQFEGNVIYPKVVGTSVGLPGIWVLLSLIIFAGSFGLIGILLAVPTTACLYNLCSIIVNYILQKKHIVVTTDTIEKTN